MWLFAIFVAVPMIEIGLFIKVGGLIGLWPTLAIVLATAIAGSWLVRAQGAREVANLRRSFSDLRDPSEPLANGAMILLAGALLLTPGFFTDFLGILLLIPPIRAFVFKRLKSRVSVGGFAFGDGLSQGQGGPGDVIDADFVELSSDKRPTHGASGWTKH